MAARELLDRERACVAREITSQEGFELREGKFFPGPDRRRSIEKNF